ncbi:hypothetical protein MX031_23290 [Ralstonia solanacearum]|uniref:hypothetical protein n=1 Tax=Ralstonia solanacearum TaxID=305 RepID=UPI00202A54D0|nr:hypothetical protein [Ralstonia solanacearum]MCL9861590.1 hypothetical protein [Ralstonia solanacearum]MCM2263344.1 hypothetical protein [Ralstonia solanacearum]
MPQRLLTKTGRYSRRVLYGCTAALSIAIVGAVLLFGRGIIDQYGDKQVARFVRTSGEVQTEVDELSARLAQFADLYEGVWTLRQNDVVPMRRYVGKLAGDKGATVTGADLTATPVTLISSLTKPADGARLAMALRVLRDVSGAPLMDAQKTGVTLDGFLYAPDATFLAAFPTMGPVDLQRARAGAPVLHPRSHCRRGAAHRGVGTVDPAQPPSAVVSGGRDKRACFGVAAHRTDVPRA